MIEGRYFDAQELLLMHSAKVGGPGDSASIGFLAYQLSEHEHPYEHSRFRAIFENLLTLRYLVKTPKGYVPTEEGLAVLESSLKWHTTVLRKVR